MHDITALVTPEEIHAYCLALWKTDEFKQSHDAPDGYVRRIIDGFARLPRCFGTMSDPEREKAHFSPWWNIIARRQYPNPAIHDLFYLHEIAHLVHLDYDPNASFETWLAKMFENETRASLESEVLVYGEIQGLRAQTFPHAIWADRFLAETQSPLDAGTLLPLRRAAVQNPQDDIERQLALFGAQNMEWGVIWRARFREVERAMARLVADAQHDRHAALEAHLAWHERQCRAGGALYPFPEEANAFAAVYWGRIATLARLSEQPEPDRIAARAA